MLKTNSDTLTDQNPADSGLETAAPDFPHELGPYVLLQRLARGGIGHVMLAKTRGPLNIEKYCVVKTLRDRYSSDPEYVTRFMDEARLVVQLSHRNICPVFDVGRTNHVFFLAMELVEGRDLRALQRALEARGRRLSLDHALHISCEVLEALDYAHRHTDRVTGQRLDLVHRDVSPQNVMMNTEGELKLIDFGLAERGDLAVLRETPNTTNAVVGKVAYMSPEQARGSVVDARADQFSAAVLTYELVTSERYYHGLADGHLEGVARAGEHQAPRLRELDPGLRRVLKRALAPRREDRYPTCAEFGDELMSFARIHRLQAGARELRALMAETFPDDTRELRALLQRFAHVSVGRNRSRTRG
jgi:serine/threonine-protein kinase